MTKQTVRKQAEALGVKIASSLGLSLWDVEYVKEGASYYLRYYIDKPGGIFIEDCEAFSHAVDPLLDKEDFIPDAYFLEVSSPGTERKLVKSEHFTKYAGEQVRVHLIRAVDGIKDYIGTLTAFEDGIIFLDVNGETKNLDIKACSWVKLYDSFAN